MNREFPQDLPEAPRGLAGDKALRGIGVANAIVSARWVAEKVAESADPRE